MPFSITSASRPVSVPFSSGMILFMVNRFPPWLTSCPMVSRRFMRPPCEFSFYLEGPELPAKMPPWFHESGRRLSHKVDNAIAALTLSVFGLASLPRLLSCMDSATLFRYFSLSWDRFVSISLLLSWCSGSTPAFDCSVCSSCSLSGLLGDTSGDEAVICCWVFSTINVLSYKF